MQYFKNAFEPELTHFMFAKPFPYNDDTALDAIEKGADRVLEEVGIRFQDDPETTEMLVQAGAIVDGDIVRLDGRELRRIIRENAPNRFLLRARNSAHDTIIGGQSTPVFAPTYGTPEVLLEKGIRVKGTRTIYHQLVSEIHYLPGLSNTGQMICVMNDIDEAKRPLEMLLAHLKLSDKPFMGNIASPKICQEVIELSRTIIGRPVIKNECNLIHLINCTPPLTYWENPLKCLRTIALNGEASMISSYMMMGATSPTTLAGTLIQGYAEVLVGLALTQLWHRGVPVVMGILGMPFDMRSMLPNFGDPVSQLIQFYAAALGRRLGIPTRGDGTITSSKVDDAQAREEGQRALYAAVMSGSDFVLHSAGWLQQGRCLSIEKLRRDAYEIATTYIKTSETCDPPLPVDSTVEAEIVGRLAII